MTQPNSDPSQPQTKRRLPWPFILILATVLIPIIAAYVAYYTGWGVADETVNKGILLEPAIPVSSLYDAADDLLEGANTAAEFTERKWRLLLPVTVPCSEGCQQNLYTTRQVHIRLNEKGERVERIAVNLAGERGEELLAELKEQHPLLKRISVDRERWQAWLAPTNAPDSLEQKPFYLLVDQEGFAMMYYTVDHHGNELLDDIKRVLRYTPE